MRNVGGNQNVLNRLNAAVGTAIHQVNKFLVLSPGMIRETRSLGDFFQFDKQITEVVPCVLFSVACSWASFAFSYSWESSREPEICSMRRDSLNITLEDKEVLGFDEDIV
jgi:hypothetical protein